MTINTFKNYEELSENIADYVLVLIKNKPNACIVLTSGDTPKLAYQILSKKATKEEFENVQIIGLDEWVGISGENEGSCRYIVEQNLLLPLGISEKNYTFFDATSDDLLAECKRIDEMIFRHGGLDLIVVGIGMNGHLGLNEPGSSFDNYCHVSDLAETTITVGQKYFLSETTLSKGITVGLKHLLEAKCAIVMANGNKKADVINKMVCGAFTEEFPASIIQKHNNGQVWIDAEASSNIQKSGV